MSIVTRVPFTLVFLVLMVLANSMAGTLSGQLPAEALERWGLSHHSIRSGELTRLFTATFLSHNLGMFLRQIVFAAVIIGAYEWMMGTRRALAMFVCLDLLGTIAVLFVVLPMLVTETGPVTTDTLFDFDVGMSAGGFGLIGALIALQKWRWILLAAVALSVAVKIWIAFDPIADSVHILCLVVGFAVQSFQNGRHGNSSIAKR